MTSDKRLAEYVREETNGAKNVRVLGSVDDLESFINTLVSEVTEEFVSNLKLRVEPFFFEKEKESSLYYKKGLQDRLEEEFGHELEAVLNEDEHRKNGAWWIDAPLFNRKEKQRTYWITTITVDAKLFKYQRPTLPASSMPAGLADFGLLAAGNRLEGVVARKPSEA